MGGVGIPVEGKAALLPLCISSPQLHPPGAALQPCSASSLSHVPPAAGAATSPPSPMGQRSPVLSLKGLEQAWVGSCHAKIEAGQ